MSKVSRIMPETGVNGNGCKAETKTDLDLRNGLEKSTLKSVWTCVHVCEGVGDWVGVRAHVHLYTHTCMCVGAFVWVVKTCVCVCFCLCIFLVLFFVLLDSGQFVKQRYLNLPLFSSELLC